ncbi:MAG: (2,3-dihydroxybenzoyl)adenylate synthase [Bacillaceae bacterium]|nr:MAG: (2,3-dihydroxybenzoyl)adenylate synthase [Bacillaceae bacterium]
MLEGYTKWPEELAAFYRKEGCWAGQTFGDLLRERALNYGDRVAVSFDGSELTYRELDQRATELASGLQRIGIQKEDRVVIQLPNRIEFFETIFALFYLGALPVFTLPSHRYNEIRHFCEFSEAKAYIIPDEYRGFDYRSLARQVKNEVPTLKHVIVIGEAEEFESYENVFTEPAELPTVQSSDVAFLQLSGGSTGLPKLIPRTHDEYIYTLRLSADICRLHPDSIYLGVLPIAHNYPLSSPGVLGTLYAGGKVVLADSPSPDEAFALIEKERVTITSLVPPLVWIWLDAYSDCQYDLSSLEVLQVGGGNFSPEVAKQVQPVLGCKLQQVYGMAEGLVNYTRLDDPDEIVINTQGRPMSPYDEIKIVDEEENEVGPGKVGELLTRGPYTIRGYYKAEAQNAKSFTADGFYRTGDLVKLTPSGYLVVEGRVKDQINRGGEKIAAEEMENHLLEHPSVRDAAVVAIPDKFLGERSCAFVIPSDSALEAAELKLFLEKRGVASFKIPDRIEFVDSFPKTPVGKIDKRALRKIVAEKQSPLVQPSEFVERK